MIDRREAIKKAIAACAAVGIAADAKAIDLDADRNLAFVIHIRRELVFSAHSDIQESWQSMTKDLPALTRIPLIIVPYGMTLDLVQRPEVAT